MKSSSRKSNLIMSCPYCYSDSHFMDDCQMKDRKFTIFTKNFLRILGSSRDSTDRI